MTQLLSKTHLQVVSSIFALMLLLSTIPFSTGVVIVPGQGGPEFTINLCQPAQLFGQASNNIIARPSANVPQFILFFRGPLRITPAAAVLEHHVAPETPPPQAANLREFPQQRSFLWADF
jgi:hypothetical protein